MSETILTTLITQEAISDRVDQIAAKISSDSKDAEQLVVVGVLKGAFIFLADLSRRLTVPHHVEFIAVASYGRRGASAGAVRLLMDVREDIKDKHVLVVEDIVDTGHTLAYLIKLLKTRKPASLRTCALVRKASRAVVPVPLDYLGFDIPDKWVVGYGLDYAEQHRTLPYIGVLEQDDAE